MSRRRDNLVMIAVVAVIALIAAWVYLPGSTTETVTSGATSSTDQGFSDTGTLDTDSTNVDEFGNAADATRFGDGPWMAWEDLPPEAVDTLLLIDSDGPYPYSKDGSTFQNREGFLPDQDRGYYREFTVETPGSRDRGARRIVGGADGDLWYTSDHYESFTEIVGW